MSVTHWYCIETSVNSCEPFIKQYRGRPVRSNKCRQKKWCVVLCVTCPYPCNQSRMWADAQRDDRPDTKFGWRPLLECRAVKLPIYDNARLGRKVNFVPGKTPLGGKSPRKCMYIVPAQETAKHRAKFGWSPFSDVDAVTKPTRVTFLWSRYVIGQTITFLPCDFYLLLSSFFFPSPNLSACRRVCLPYFHTWCGLSANLECTSEMCCTRLAENTGRKKSPFCHHRTTLSGCIFAAEACIDNRKKTCYTSIPPPHVLVIRELRPTNGWDLLASLGHPCKFQRLSRLGSVTARHSSCGRQPNFAALNRGRHLYSAGRPSLWALAHILVLLGFKHLNHVCVVH